jgi:hypothetical protein
MTQTETTTDICPLCLAVVDEPGTCGECDGSMARKFAILHECNDADETNRRMALEGRDG